VTPSLPDDLLQRLAEAALRRYAAEVGLCAKPKVTLMVPDLPGSYGIEVTAHPLH